MSIELLVKAYEEMTLDEVPVEEVLNDLHELEEFCKPTVKQFVANWYEQHKYDFEFNVWDYVYRFEGQEETSFKKWFNDSKENPFQTLVKMHLFGYEVEEEKKYIIKVKNVQSGTMYLKYDRVIEDWYFGIKQDSVTTLLYHTKEELEKGGFGWVFSCEGVEVTEVEEG